MPEVTANGTMPKVYPMVKRKVAAVARVSKHKEAAVAKETNKKVVAKVDKEEEVINGLLRAKAVAAKEAGPPRVKETGMVQAKALRAITLIPANSNGSKSQN
jgi:hypothetical protein